MLKLDTKMKHSLNWITKSLGYNLTWNTRKQNRWTNYPSGGEILKFKKYVQYIWGERERERERERENRTSEQLKDLSYIKGSGGCLVI